MPQLPPSSFLMSPPEPGLLESFDSPTKPRHTTSQAAWQNFKHETTSLSTAGPNAKVDKVLPSPPASPWTKFQSKAGETHETSDRSIGTEGFVQDPILFPNDDSIEENQPLFDPEPNVELVEAIDRHMACHFLKPKSKGDLRTKRYEMPTREQYMLALSLLPTIGRSYNHNPGSYLKRERDEIEGGFRSLKRARTQAYARRSKVSGKSHSTPAYTGPAKGVEHMATKSAADRRPVDLSQKRPRQRRPDRSGTPTVRAPGTKRANDIDHRTLPDYSPPLSTLPSDPKALKVDWRSNGPVPLSDDMDRRLLHEAEKVLASTLRLQCSQYLVCKKRIFMQVLENHKKGKPFRKTDAQQACNIDVNKASQLWTAFNKVGWFDRKHFSKHLESPL